MARSDAIGAAMSADNHALTAEMARDEAEGSAQTAHDAAVGAGQSATQAIEAAANSGVFRDQAVAAKNEAMASAASVSKGTDPEQLVRAGDLGTGAWIDQTWLHKTAYWDAPSIAASWQEATAISVPGAEIGDFVLVSCNFDLTKNLVLYGFVSAVDTVTIAIRNNGASAADLNMSTYYIAVLKRVPVR